MNKGYCQKIIMYANYVYSPNRTNNDEIIAAIRDFLTSHVIKNTKGGRAEPSEAQNCDIPNIN